MTDPTLQTSGSLEALLRMDWNCSYLNFGTGAPMGMPGGFDSIQYGPANAPPPAWARGTQYYALPAGSQVPGFGAMITAGNNFTSQAGYAGIVLLTDMSTNTVLPGKTYAVTADVGQYIQLYFLVTGASAGATVRPGFGLWNLGTNPNAWTYVTPTEFTGEWEIGLLSPVSDAPVWLSIEYAPPKNYGQGMVAKLIFTCRGGTITQYWSTSSAQHVPAVTSPAPSPGSHRPVGTQHLHERSDPYVARNKDGEVLTGS